MKKTVSIIIVALVVIALIVGVVLLINGKGQGKTKLSAYSGKYKGEYTKFVGDPEGSKVTNEEFSLVLKEDGTGLSYRDDNSYNVTWSIEGETFKMTEKFIGMTIDYTGTLKDGKIDIFNGDPSNDFTCEYVYSK